jgi:hypothetical protein
MAKMPIVRSLGSKAARGRGPYVDVAASGKGDLGNGGFKGADDTKQHQNIGKKGGTAPESPFAKPHGNMGKGFDIDSSAKKADILGRDLKHTSAKR